MKNYYEFYNPVQIVAGKNVIAECLGELLITLNAKRILVISGPTINKLGLTDFVGTAIKKNGIDVGAYYVDVPNESSVKTIEEICNIYKINNCDGIVALGGGSVLDTAKASKLMLSQKAMCLKELYGYDMIGIGNKIPMILIPTTCGTGAEVTRVAVISDENNNGLKEEIISNEMLPDYCLLDPKMIKTLPSKSVLLTAFDAMSHAIEGYCCLQKNPISDRYSVLAIRMLVDNLEKYIENPKDDDIGLKLLEASNYAGISFSNSMVGAVHAIGHSLGVILNIGHDLAISRLLPYVLSYNIEYAKQYYEELYYYVVDNDEYYNTPKEEMARAFVLKIHDLFKRVADKLGNVPKLVDCGLCQQKFNEIITKTLNDGAILTETRYMQKQDIANILNMALEEKL